MSGRTLLDTNIVIALFANDASVTERLREAEEVFVPSIVLGELYYGAQKSRRVEENEARIDEPLSLVFLVRQPLVQSAHF